MSPPSSTATVAGGVSLLPPFGLVAVDPMGGWSGCSAKSVGVKSSSVALSETSRFLYAAFTSRGPIGTSRGTSRWGSTCSAMRLKTGAATCPPSCCPTGESSDTRIVTAGLLMGANPAKEAISRSEEHTSELQSRGHLVCRLLLEKKKVQQPGTS